MTIRRSFLLLPFALLGASALVAADVSGKWSVTSQDNENRTLRSVLTLTDNGGTWSGVFRFEGRGGGEARELAATKVGVDGDKLTIVIPWGDDTTVTITLNHQNGKLEGQWRASSGETGPISAVRPETKPAGVAGKWNITAVSASGREIKAALTLEEKDGALAGSLTPDQGPSMPCKEAKMESGNLSLKLETDQGAYVIKMAMAGDGQSMKGTFTAPDGRTGNITAAR